MQLSSAGEGYHCCSEDLKVVSRMGPEETSCSSCVCFSAVLVSLQSKDINVWVVWNPYL